LHIFIKDSNPPRLQRHILIKAPKTYVNISCYFCVFLDIIHQLQKKR